MRVSNIRTDPPTFKVAFGFRFNTSEREDFRFFTFTDPMFKIVKPISFITFEQDVAYFSEFEIVSNDLIFEELFVIDILRYDCFHLTFSTGNTPNVFEQ